MIDLRHIAVRYRLGLQDTDSLIRIADILLAEGHTEPAIIELSMMESPVMIEVAPVFERVCAELGFPIPTREEAIDELLKGYLKSIASGGQSPRDGLQAIMQEVYFPHLAKEPVKKYVGDSHGMEHLIGAYWGYDDLMERPREISFDGKYGKEAITSWEEFVRQHARDWLQKHNNDC